jgi:metal-dependent amidase/aminoacylase/carboxypeptidase family protein
LRRDFHQNPELEIEFKTAEKLLHILQFRYRSTNRNRKTGVVGILRGSKPGPVIALRADIDALPVKERSNSIRFQSRRRIQRKNSSCNACLWS